MVGQTTSGNRTVIPVAPQRNTLANMTNYRPLDTAALTNIVQHLRPTTCSLDTLPTTFFKNVFNCIAPDVLQIVNSSLQTGTFPKALKTAVIKPLLKKSDVDASAINNYRPISNLPFLGKIIAKAVCTT